MTEARSLWEIGSKPILSSFDLPIPSPALAAPPATENEAGPSRPRTPLSAVTSEVENLSINPNSKTAHTGDAILSPDDVSIILTQALHQVLSSDDPPEMPIPASQLYSAHILPSRPAYLPEQQRGDAVIGKSSWKKLAKWMKEASKDGLIKVKESKGEAIVQRYSYSRLA